MHDTRVTKPNVAGIYNAFLNGNTSSAADRETAIEVQKAIPDVLGAAEENRSFLRRCIRYMLGHGIKQFIDIGPGFITDDDIHELTMSDVDGSVPYVTERFLWSFSSYQPA
ncbi:S-adenosyl methyltransferase-domain-containing protein [Phaeosphaeriaceae sp. PMI808]|nr:S-adenosyl methyltransferase-domain-containing protein [Phaeosphaeriaceae sp. PMI808]